MKVLAPEVAVDRPAFGSIYKETFQLLQREPLIVFLFFFLAIFDLIALTFLFLAPSEPVSFILAPIIRTFWDELYLHYPENLSLLPKLFTHAHFVMMSFFGIVFIGAAIKKIEAYTAEHALSATSAAGFTLQKYFKAVIAWLISYAAFIYVLKHLLVALPPSVAVQLTGGFLLGLTMQSLFVFLLPSVLISKKGMFKALAHGMVFGVRHFLKTASLLALPMLLISALSYFRLMTPLYMRTDPDRVLWVLVIGIFVSMAVDLFVTSITTLYFIQERGSEK
jgi:hypothetical protein